MPRPYRQAAITRDIQQLESLLATSADVKAAYRNRRCGVVRVIFDAQTKMVVSIDCNGQA